MKPKLEGNYRSSPQDINSGFRIPQDLYQKITDLASEENRSINGTIVLLLKSAFEKPTIEKVYELCREIRSAQDKALDNAQKTQA